MPGMVLTLPIAAGKVEAWRRFSQELSGSRRHEYETSRQRLGIRRECLALVENAYGAAAVTTLEAREMGWVLGQILTSDLPFDRWYREQIQELYGLNLTEYGDEMLEAPLPGHHELLFEWKNESD